MQSRKGLHKQFVEDDFSQWCLLFSCVLWRVLKKGCLACPEILNKMTDIISHKTLHDALLKQVPASLLQSDVGYVATCYQYYCHSGAQPRYAVTGSGNRLGVKGFVKARIFPYASRRATCLT